MGFNDFWINNNGKKEHLNNAKHGVRKEQVDKKVKKGLCAKEIADMLEESEEVIHAIVLSLSKETIMETEVANYAI